MTPQFDLTWFYDVILRNSVFQLGFLTREFQIPYLRMRIQSLLSKFQVPKTSILEMKIISLSRLDREITWWISRKMKKDSFIFSNFQRVKFCVFVTLRILEKEISLVLSI